jgi:regulator of nucleoside diphosphate kinase
MANYYELIVSASDAEALARVLGKHVTDPLEAQAADALADVLFGAHLVPHERLLANRVRMNSNVIYREEPDGAARAVRVVHPNEADTATGRISVLSPVGRALLGRKAGALIAASAPGGRELKIRILRVERPQDAPVLEGAS